MKNLTISSHYAKAIVKGAVNRGLNAASLLQQAGIDPELVEQPMARIHAEKFIDLYQLAWREMDDEFLGRTTSPCKLGCFYLMGSLVIHSENLEEVIRQSIRCYRIFSQDIEMVLNFYGDEVEFSIRHLKPPVNDPDYFLIEWLLVVWHRFIGWLIGKKIVLNRASFQHAMPPHVKEYRNTFQCKSVFGEPRNSIFFSKNYLSMPVTRSIEELKRFMTDSPRDLLIWKFDDGSVTSQVRNVLEHYAEDRLPNLDWVAEQLGSTPHTISRRLKTEGSSYQMIKDLHRRDQAIVMLTRQNLTISDISAKLGFTEPGAFSRAFKSWTGVSPLAYRKQ